MTGNNVLVELDNFPVKPIPGGTVYQPDIAQERPYFGKVYAVGPGHYTKKNKFVPTEINVNDRVCMPWGEGNELKINGKIFMIISESKILGIVQ